MRITVASIAFLMLVLAPTVRAEDLSSGDWRLWLDQSAPWKADKIYLPDEVDLAKLPINAPTGGWQVLDADHGIPVSLPGTVEAHYWDKLPDALDQKAKQKPSQIVQHDGRYLGVSWWYRPFKATAMKEGERLILSIRGSRLRTEVYVNGKLCGYNIITELPFSADLTDAVQPGADNLLAIRITNPGGNLAWQDYGTFKWGGYVLPASHGFGGIDAGVSLDVRAAVNVSDLYVLNTADPKTVIINAQISSSRGAYDGPVELAIQYQGKPIWKGDVDVRVAPGGTGVASQKVTIPDAHLWDFDSPVLYTAIASLPNTDDSERSTAFGFRWFSAVGIGDDAKLIFNGRRIVLRSSISWGFWAPNGVWPDAAEADKEAAAAKALGLNCVQNHRHMPKPAVLDAFDRAGVLRYCEPGSGISSIAPIPTTKGDGPVDPSGTGGEPSSFTNRYELAKILGMIKYNRSHPSVIIWCLQNEMDPNLHDPRLFYVLHQMQEADPSRIILTKSGIGADHEAWALPYTPKLMFDDSKRFNGWTDRHTAEQGKDVYNDGTYRSASQYEYQSDNLKAISMWGEMATSASCDDHELIVRDYQATKQTGYDRAAHEAILAGYNQFLDKFNFRSAFPKAEAIFRSVGNRHYLMDARLMENARISDANDYIVLSGWESTTIDNHSGMLDAHRNFKGDPNIVKEASAPQLLVIRLPHYVIAKGDTASVDVHLVNETNLHGTFHLAISAAGADGKPFFSSTPSDVPVTGGDVFGQLLKEKITFVAASAGPVDVTATLWDADPTKPLLTRTAQIYVVDVEPKAIERKVALIEPIASAPAGAPNRKAPDLSRSLHLLYGISSTALAENDKPDVIIIHFPTRKPARATATKPAEVQKPSPWADAIEAALPHVKEDGARLVLLADARDIVDAAATLGKLGIVDYRGHVGPSGANWFGSWYFVRDHWLFAGLPVNCAMDWQYQVSGNSGDGLLMDAPGIDVAAGYSRDHSPDVGIGAAVIPVGKGQIVLICLPGFEHAIVTNESGDIHPDAARRILYNAIAGGN